MKRLFSILFCFLLISIGLSFHALAQEPDIQSTVPSAKVVDQSAYRIGERLVISDLINGDLFCMGGSVVVDAIVNGDIICAGGTVIIRGDTTGDVRVVASTITVDGNVSGNATLIGGTVIVTNNTTIGEDINIVAQRITHDGSIERDALFRAQNITVNGDIGRRLQLFHGDSALISDAATIGSLAYASPDNIQLPKSMIGAPIEQMPVDMAYKINNILQSSIMLVALLYIGLFISLLLTALGVAFLFPRSLEDSIYFATKQPATTLGAGVITLILIPPSIVLLLISIVGIPLALIIGSLFFAVVLLSAPFVAHYIGNMFFPERSHPIRALVGAIILILLYAIPVINIFTAIMTTVFGTGLIIRVATKRYSAAATLYKKSTSRATIKTNGNKEKTTTKKNTRRTR